MVCVRSFFVYCENPFYVLHGCRILRVRCYIELKYYRLDTLFFIAFGLPLLKKKKQSF